MLKCLAALRCMLPNNWILPNIHKKGVFCINKLKLADYFIDHILPRMQPHIEMVQAGSESMMALDLAYFEPA